LELQEQYLRELKKFFWENSLSPDIYQIERLAHFASLVAEKNEEVNLISRKDAKNIIENHVFFSSFMSGFLPERTTKFIDIGTGGGFPGIPIGIMNPLLQGVLVDATSKKISAVQEFIATLKLHNVVAENSRVEDEDFKEKYKNSFDLVVSRATVPLIILLRYSLPLIKERAYIVASKGGDLAEELKTAEMKYRAHIKKSTIYELPYKPTNSKNEKGKKLVILDIVQ